MPPKPRNLHETVIDRRSFLLSTLGASTGLIWQGCSCSEDGPTAKPSLVSDAGIDAAEAGVDGATVEGGVDAGTKSAFGTLRTLRDVIRSSPDHLAARAAEAIATKDPLRVIRWVRDSIAVLPPPDANTAAVDAVRWGPAATLRAGAGTLRERAELLAAMLQAMGATTKVVRAARPTSVSLAALYGTSPPAFTPDDVLFARFVATPEGAPFAKLNAPSTGPDPTAVTNTLSGVLPAGTAVAKAPFDGDDPVVPIVEYTLGGSTRWAFAMGSVDEVSSSPASLGGALIDPTYPTVSVRVLAQLGDVPGVPTSATGVELAAGTWTADQVAGQRLTIAFVPPDPSNAPAPTEEMPIRVAALTLQGQPQDGTEAGSAYTLFRPALATEPTAGFTGAPFTLSGVQFAVNADGSLAGPYGDMQKLASSAHDAAVASVSTLEVVTNGGAFPDVQLTVRALDGSGSPVFGLGVGDFTVTDESKTQQALLVSNAKVGDVRVLVAYDCSGSIQWPTPADKTAFDNAIAQALVSSAAKSPFELAVTPLGGSASAASFTAPVATDIVAAVTGCVGFSELWTSLGQVAVDAGVSAVIIVSDFNASDTPASIPGLQQRLAASGLEVALIPTTGAMQTVIDQIVAVAGATQLDPTATDFGAKLDDFVTKATQRVTTSGYRFTYRLPSDQLTTATTRTAAVALAKRQTIRASGTYTVPAVDQRGLRGVAGLSLEIRVGPDTVTRWLSGPRANRFGNFPTPVAADLADTESLLNGHVTVAFEPGSPTVAANLDDLVSGVLSTEPILRAVGMPGPAALEASTTFHPYGSGLAALVDPVKRFDSGPVVAPRALKVVIESRFASGGDLFDRFDLVPELNRAVAASTDAAASFAAVMATSVGASLREGAVGFSSADKLAAASLQYLAAGAAVTTLTGFAATDLTRWSSILDQYGDYHRLIPKDPTLEALWIIDPATGSTFAVYLDGTGGSCRHAQWNQDLQAAMVVLNLCASYKTMVCKGMRGFACVGAEAATVFAGAAATFAAWYLDSVSYRDVMAIIIAFIASVAGDPAMNAASLGIGTGLALAEASNSIDQECRYR